MSSAAARYRRLLRRLLLLSLLAALLFLLLLFGNSEGPLPILAQPPVPVDQTDCLRVVCFNMLHGWPDFPDQAARYERTRDALAKLRPDLLILQEAWRVRGHGDVVTRLARDLALGAVYARANGRRWLIGFEEGSALLSRFPIVAAERLLLSPRRPFWECRIALRVTLEIGGQEVVVVGTHLGQGGTQAADLSRRLHRPLLVAGDFNAGPESPALSHFSGFANPISLGIDHLLVAERRGWRIADSRRLFEERRPPLSDHPGLLVVLERE